VTEFFWTGVVSGVLWTNVAWVCGLIVFGVVREIRGRKADDRKSG
jgi:hypothetical protein